MSDPGFFQAVYESGLHHPGACWLAGALFLLVLLRRLPFFWAWLVGCLFLTASDAMVSGFWYSHGGASSPWIQPIQISFVILGDWRYFLLMHRFAVPSGERERAGLRRLWIPATLWAFVVPVLQAIATRVWPEHFSELRWVFLIYELLFVVLALGFLFFWLPRKLAGRQDARAKWLRQVTLFVLLQYGLWASADVAILWTGDPGYALRLVPNLMYYAFFLPFVFWRAPQTMRRVPG